MAIKKINLIERDLDTVKTTMLDIAAHVEKEFQYLLNFKQSAQEDVSKNKIWKLHQQIKRKHYRFIELAMWKITKRQMLAIDLRRAVTYINIVQHWSSISHYCVRLERYMVKYAIPKSIQSILNEAIINLNNQLSIVKHILETDDLKQIRKLNNQNLKIHEINFEQQNDIWGLAADTQDTQELRMLWKSFRLVTTINSITDQIFKIGKWVYYMVYGKMYSDTSVAKQKKRTEH